MKHSEPIVDYHGTEITVDGPVFKSAGAFIYLEFSGRELSASEVLAECLSGEFGRLTPDQAEDLGEWLIAAAKATRR